ncbi:unnamed protein product [Lupinus luteus]|uniref:Protein kinase domain-containing protein n=1 Tax=Lupinus luteus TaxID=3873 RepID=A0AAV1WQH3_LUPLU
MRWFSTLIFSPSSSSSSSAHSSSSDAATPTRGLWVFWTGKRSRRSRKLQQLGHHVGNGKSPPMWHETVDDIVVTHPTSLSRSPSVVSRSSTSSFDRCYNRSTSVAPQPLPLPELVSSAVIRNNRDADSRLPSPKYAVGPTTSVSKATQVDGAVDGVSSTGFRMRSVFASQKKNKEQVETRTPGMGPQDTNGSASTQSDSNFWINVPARSVPCSPFGSPTIKPHITRNEDFLPYHYVTPKTNQFWSAPEMPKYETLAGLPLPAFFDLSSLGSTINNNNSTYSPHHSPRGTSPCQQQHPKSPSTRSSSPMPRRENIAPLTVHPLPLPPWAGSGAGSALPSPSSTFSQPGTKTEPLSMKFKWQKGKLIGRGTFGSVYVATNRDIKGANLLVDSAGVVKLADFGMAKHLTGHSADLSLKGSPYWMAPELMQAVMQKDNSSDLAFAVDIWSLGCTIIEMFTGKPPWSEYEGAAAMFKVMKDTPPIPETLSPEGKDFLRLCFKRNPAERPTASMLLDHRFLKNNLQQQDISSESGGTVPFSLYS